MKFVECLGRVALVTVVSSLPVVACSASSSDVLGGAGAASGTGAVGGVGAVAGGASGSGGFVSSTGSQSSAGGVILGIGGDVMTRDAGGACKGDTAAAEQVQLDLYVMVDQSLSMVAPDASGMTRWAAVTSALQQFYQSPASAGIGVGMQFFGLGLGGISCTAADYAMPEVEIAPLPGNAMALTMSLAAHGPSSVTPTPAALQGAILHAQDWKKSHQSHAVAVLLVTDGEPDLCGLTPDVASAAMAGLTGTPPIQTFVLGVGTSLDALNQVAMAGGSGQAYIVSGNTNVAQSVLDALNKIRAATALPCDFTLPKSDPGKPIDYSMVNVLYTPQGGASEVVYYASDPSKCTPMNKAWYYDNPRTPTRIVLCDDTCKAISTGGGTIGYQLFCPVKPLPIE
jgi:hypothetical protein